MCGRLVVNAPAEAVGELLGITEMPATWPLRYNLAPSDLVPIVREAGHLELLRWGMKMSNPRAAGINARCESIGLYDTRSRCLVVASGFYEWRRLGGTRKQPHFISRLDGKPIVFAGLFDATDGVALVTAPATGIVAELHDRMPVVLEPASFDAYLDPGTNIGGFFSAASAGSLTMYPVGAKVGNVRFDHPALLERVPESTVAAEPKQLGLF